MTPGVPLANPRVRHYNLSTALGALSCMHDTTPVGFLVRSQKPRLYNTVCFFRMITREERV